MNVETTFKAIMTLTLLSFLCAGCHSTTTYTNGSYSTRSSENKTITKEQPNKIALLVPLHGKFSTAGNAVRNGFFAAYFASSDKHKPEIKIYDTSQKTSVSESYEKAIQEGANFVVGPLVKTNVQTLSHQSSLSVPTLTLNYTPTNVKLPSNMYQLGISPEDEAMQVAIRASESGLSRAIVIYPKGRWGNGIAQAFDEQFQKAGGLTVDSLAYSSKGPNKEEIANLLQFKEQDPKNSSNNASQKNLKPQRREDIDMIFLVATPQQARSITPLLRFYYAGDIPLFSTSLVYSGTPNPTLDHDLNGIIFCDMPLIIAPDATNPVLQQKLVALWPSDYQRNARLFALGADAYEISKTGIINFQRKNNTGQLYLSNRHQLRRKLIWAQILNGVPTQV